jgi:hypothetical protein
MLKVLQVNHHLANAEPHAMKQMAQLNLAAEPNSFAF